MTLHLFRDESANSRMVEDGVGMRRLVAGEAHGAGLQNRGRGKIVILVADEWVAELAPRMDQGTNQAGVHHFLYVNQVAADSRGTRPPGCCTTIPEYARNVQTSIRGVIR